MVNLKEDLVSPVFQHLVPVLVYETSRVLGFVPIKSTMFLRAGTYVLWTNGPAVQLDCVTQPKQVVLHGNKKIQFLAIVYKEKEINKRFNLKGFISTDSKQRQYQSQWISIKPGAYQLYDVNIFAPFFTGIWDTSSDYERAHTKNEDYADNTESSMNSTNLNWCLKLPVTRFANDYDYIDSDWIKLFHMSLAKKNLVDTPTDVQIVEYPETNALKISLMNDVIEAGQSSKHPNSTLPSTLQIMRLHELQAGVYKFVLQIKSQETVYNITISLVLTSGA